MTFKMGYYLLLILALSYPGPLEICWSTFVGLHYEVQHKSGWQGIAIPSVFHVLVKFRHTPSLVLL